MIEILSPTLLRSTDPDERELVNHHLSRLSAFRLQNRRKYRYYDGKSKLRELGFAQNKSELRRLEGVVGWPGTVVDVLAERLNFLGWTDLSGALGLDAIRDANYLSADAAGAHTDALVTGTAFVIVGRGGDGEPDPLITIEDANAVTGEWDARKRRLSSALSIDDENAPGDPRAVTLYLPNADVTFEKRSAGWTQTNRVEHRLGRVLVARLTNRPRASHPLGRSEITPSIRSHTDSGVRTILGMEVNREFFSAPQRAAIGANPDDFVKGDQTATGWELVIGSWLNLSRDPETDEKPELIQFPQSQPGPYLEQIRGLSQLIAADAAIPAPYLGFVSENPSSADAIRQMEARLIKRSEERQSTFGIGWREVAALALLVRDGAIPEEFSQVGVKWRDPSTPTRAADTDAAVKLVQAGILPPDSSVTWDRLGLSPAEQQQLSSDLRRNRASTALSSLAQLRAQQLNGGTPPVTEEPTSDDSSATAGD